MNTSKIDLTDTEIVRLKDEFDAVKKVHKNFFSSFEIIVPKVSKSIIDSTFVCSFASTNLEENFWISAPGTSFFFDDMMVNYEREMGDNIAVQKDQIEVTFYCCVNLKNPGFSKSDRWVVVGFMPVGKDLGLPWIWLHPYLRGQGIVRNFLKQYCLNYGPLMFETPIKPRLQKIIEELSEEILQSPEDSKKYCKGLRDYLERRYEGSMSNMSDDNIWEIISLINHVLFLQPNINKKDELRIVGDLIGIRKYCNGDEEKLKEFFPDVDLAEIKSGKYTKMIMEDSKRRMSLGRLSDSFLDRMKKFS